MKLLLFGTLYVGWMVFYLCQRTLPSSIPYIISNESDHTSQQHHPFSQAYLGQLLSLFAASSSLSFLLSGILSDVINVRLLFPIAMGLSGCILVTFPLIGRNQFLGSLLFVFLGLTLGCGWPCTANILRQIYKPSELGTPWGIMSSSSSVATLMAPLLASKIISYGSWKDMFYTFGFLAVALATPIMVVTKYITVPSSVGKLREEPVSSSKMRWFHLVFNGHLRNVMVMHTMMWVVKASVMDWGQLYLIKEQQLDKLSAGHCIAFMQVGGVMGKLIMGYVSNFAMKCHGTGNFESSGQTYRTLVLVGNLVVLLVAVVLFGSIPAGPVIGMSHYYTLAVIFSIGLFSEGAILCIALTSMEVVPSNLAGTGQALSAASAQLIGKSLAGWPFSALTRWIGWSYAFSLLSVGALIAVIVGCGLLVSFHRQHLQDKKEK